MRGDVVAVYHVEYYALGLVCDSEYNSHVIFNKYFYWELKYTFHSNGCAKTYEKKLKTTHNKQKFIQLVLRVFFFKLRLPSRVTSQYGRRSRERCTCHEVEITGAAGGIENKEISVIFSRHFEDIQEREKEKSASEANKKGIIFHLEELSRLASRYAMKKSSNNPEDNATNSGLRVLKCFFKLWYFTFTVEDIFFVFGRATAYYTRRQAVKIATLEGTLTRFSLPSFFFPLFLHHRTNFDTIFVFILRAFGCHMYRAGRLYVA